MKWLPIPLILAGCCTAPEPITVVETLEVEVPVMEKCPVEMPRRVAYSTRSVKKEDSDFDKIRALLMERRERDAAEQELRELLAVCLN